MKSIQYWRVAGPKKDLLCSDTNPEIDNSRKKDSGPQTGHLCICPCHCLCICPCHCLCVCLFTWKTARQEAGSISCALSGKQDQTGGNPTTCPLIFTPDRLLDYLTPHGPPSEKRCSVPQCIEESSHYLEYSLISDWALIQTSTIVRLWYSDLDNCKRVSATIGPQVSAQRRETSWEDSE